MKIFKTYTTKQIFNLLVISGLLLIENIDGNILNIAIPQMSHTFGTSVFILKLAITSYLVGLAVFIPISGWFADRFGTQKTLIASIIIFTLMSLQCGLTNSLPLLVVSRLLQGIAGAFMVPVARLLLLKIFDKSQIMKAYSVMTIVVILGPICAPILGGYLVTYFSWRYIFWVNLPLGVLALVATILYVDNYSQSQQKFSLINFIVLAIFLACISFWLDICLLPEINFIQKSALLLVAVIMGTIYINLEFKSELPVINFNLFKLRTFNICFFAGIFARAALGGRSFLLAIFLEMNFHLSAFQAGFYFIYMSLGVLSSRSLVKLIISKYGFRKTVTLANSGSSLAFLMLSGITKINIWLYCVLYISGVFSAVQFNCFNVLCYADVAEEDYSGATSLITTMQQLGASFGIVIASGLFQLFSHNLILGNYVHSFNYTFIGLALINLFAQLFTRKLTSYDGNSLIHKT